MGTDYKCGCRESIGHWFLCKDHEIELFKIISNPDIIIPKKVWNELIKDKQFVKIQNKVRRKYGFKQIGN